MPVEKSLIAIQMFDSARSRFGAVCLSCHNGFSPNWGMAADDALDEDIRPKMGVGRRNDANHSLPSRRQRMIGVKEAAGLKKSKMSKASKKLAV